MSTFVTLKHSQLVPNPLNRSVVRDAENTKRRAATIKAKGILQNIVVTPLGDSKYQIEAGSGRYESVELLIAQGDATPDFLYPALVADSSDGASAMIRLMENGNRDDLHPVDEFLSYSEAASAGESVKSIAAAQGVTQRYVKQRLKLSELAPELLEALRLNELTLDAAEAYTVADSQEAQVAAYNALASWERSSPHRIKDFLTEKKINVNSPLGKLVGKAAYRKAGGQISSDLFGDDEWFEDAEIAYKVAKEILNKEAKKLTGWKWVEVTFNDPASILHSSSGLTPIGHDVPEALVQEASVLREEFDALDRRRFEDSFTDDDQSRMWELEDQIQEIEDRKEEFAQFSPDEMLHAGCMVGISFCGSVKIVKGRVLPDDLKALNALQQDDGGALDEGEAETSGLESLGYSQALRSDLGNTRTALIQAAVAQDSVAAYDLGVFTLADSILRDGLPGWAPRPIALGITENSLDGADDTALELIEKAKNSLNLSWTKAAPADRFAQFCSLSADDKAAIFAFCVARAIPSGLAGQGESEALAATVERVAPDYRASWTPTRRSFFKRLPRGELLEVGVQILGAEWSAANQNAKKKDLVEELSRLFSGEKEVSPEVRSNIDKWVPKGF